MCKAPYRPRIAPVVLRWSAASINPCGMIEQQHLPSPTLWAKIRQIWADDATCNACAIPVVGPLVATGKADAFPYPSTSAIALINFSPGLLRRDDRTKEQSSGLTENLSVLFGRNRLPSL